MFKTKDEELQEALVEIRKKKRKKIAILASIVSVLLVALLAIIWMGGYSSAKKKADIEIENLQNQLKQQEETPVVLEPVTPEIVQKIISSSVTEISELATAEYVFTNAARFTNTKHIAVLPDSWTQKSFIQKWDGTIKAGVDLKDVEVTVKNKTITITLPYAKILSYEIDKDSVEILDEKNNVFNRITVKDKVNFDRETRYSMEARAVENGLLTKAQKNAENTILTFLSSSIKDFKDYEVKFETVDK